MLSLVYASLANFPFDEPRLLELLKASRDKNARLQVTGMLLYSQGSFMQALEGDERAVRELYVSICNDGRHRDVVQLTQSPIAEREFPDWSMGFRNISSAELGAVPGFTNYLDAPLRGQQFVMEPSKARKLLAIFSRR